MSRRAWIGLGSNLGDRRAILDGAVRALSQTPGLALEAVSPYHETAPVGGPSGQGPFLNAAAGVRTTLESAALHERLRTIEADAGRVRKVRWGERTLDLDLLLYDDLVLDTSVLTVPHPRFAVRRFVLSPLSEIATDAVDPMTGQTVRALLANLDRRPSRVAVVGDRQAEVVSGRLATLLESADWLTRTMALADLGEIARWPESERPTFVAIVEPAGPEWTRPAMARRIPVPVLWLDGLADGTAITSEIVAACEASRTG